jgi:hypothetical protein
MTEHPGLLRFLLARIIASLESSIKTCTPEKGKKEM